MATDTFSGPAPSLRSAIPGRQRWQAAGLYRCPPMVAAVEVALERLPGVTAVNGNPLTGRLLVTFETILTAAAMAAAVRAALDVPPLSPQALAVRQSALAAKRETTAEERGCEIEGSCCDIENATAARLSAYERKLWLGGVVLAGVVVRYAALGAGVAGGPTFVAVTAVVTVATGFSYLRGAFNSLFRRGRINTDTLVGTATVASILLGETASGLVVIWLLNLGEYLQALTLRRTRLAIRGLLDGGDDQVWLLDGEDEARRPIAEVQPGALVAVYPGERIPVDGTVEAGSGTVNEAPITGESMPVERAANSSVYAGTLLLVGSLRIRVQSVGADTAIGRLIRRVEEAQELKPRIQTIGERFAARFVPFSFLLAGVVLVVTGNPTQALTMLLIACPCAAGLATPTAVSASIGNAARRGILIKGGTHLESAAELDAVVFDKTGTLTVGSPAVERVLAHAAGYTADRVLMLAAAAELHSQHPLALAVVERARERGLELPPQDQLEVFAGRGLRATWEENQVIVGNRRLLGELAVVVDPDLDDLQALFAAEGESVMYVAHQGRLVGQITVRDKIRPEAFAAMAGLRAAGIPHLVMLTGDNEPVAATVARAVGLSEWRSRLLPEQKFEWIRHLRARGYHVAMVGDGINDAPALALADVGIAMGTAGSDVAIEAADIALASDNLEHVATTVRLSRRTIHLIRQNYGIALGVNSAGIVAGVFGALNPLLAAVLHNLSTLLVVLNSTRLIGYDPEAGAAPRAAATAPSWQRRPVLDDGDALAALGSGVERASGSHAVPGAAACCASEAPAGAQAEAMH